MSYNRLRMVSKYSLVVGIILLSVGVFLFMNSDAGEKSEKLGIIFMMYGGVMLGVGFTALVALKSPS